MFLLDTDHIVILQTKAKDGFDNLVDRMKQNPPDWYYHSIISLHEQFLGANTYISRAKDSSGIVRGYGRLFDFFDYFKTTNLLPFDRDAVDQFEALKKAKVRVATMDLRIAAIALANDFTVLTRNIRDFEQVPDVRVEDWTIA